MNPNNTMNTMLKMPRLLSNNRIAYQVFALLCLFQTPHEKIAGGSIT